MRPWSLLLLLGLCGAKRVAPLTWWEAREPSTFHPLWAASSTDLRAQAPVYDPLVEKVGSRWTSVLTTEPPTVADGRATLTLRRDVDWHDGERLTAGDVCATVDALRDRDHPTPLGARLGPQLRHCAALPSDPWTVVIHLAESGVPDPLSALAFPVLPAHLEGSLTDPDHPLATEPVGTGPWSVRAGQGVWLYSPEKTAHHPDRLPVLRLFPLPAAPTERTAAIEGGTVDGWPVLPADQVPTLRALDGWSLAPYPLQAVVTVALDPTEPPLSDPARRAALHAALDRKALCAELVGTWPEADRTLCRPTVSPFPLDHPATNHGIPLPEPAALPAEEDAPPLTVAIQAELELDAEALGAALESAWAPHPVTVEHLPLRSLLELPPDARRDRFDAVVSQRLPATGDLRPELGLTGPLNWFAVAAPEVQEALHATDPEAQHALHALLSDQHLLLPLVELTALSAWRDRARGLWMTPVDGLGAMERWQFTEAAPGPRRP